MIIVRNQNKVNFLHQPSWSPILSSYYQGKRVELENEINFWMKMATGHKRIMEIGAGNGFLSMHLLKKNLEILTLVEPEASNLELLYENIKSKKVKFSVKIEPIYIQDYKGEKHDLIIFPFDSIPMIPSAKEREKVFSVVQSHLKRHGKFIIHLSSRAWNEKYILENSKKIKKHFIFNGEPVSSVFQIERKTDTLYFKNLVFSYLNRKKVEKFSFPTTILDPIELINLAYKNQMFLEDVFTNFNFGRELDADDHIFVFRKV